MNNLPSRAFSSGTLDQGLMAVKQEEGPCPEDLSREDALAELAHLQEHWVGRGTGGIAAFFMVLHVLLLLNCPWPLTAPGAQRQDGITH